MIFFDEMYFDLFGIGLDVEAKNNREAVNQPFLRSLGFCSAATDDGCQVVHYDKSMMTSTLRADHHPPNLPPAEAVQGDSELRELTNYSPNVDI